MQRQPWNARFWIWWNAGWVKLTLRPGQSLTMTTGRPTDEGYHFEADTYALAQNGVVVNEWYTESRDCDGRLDTAGERYCHVSALQRCDASEYAPENAGIFTPEWVKAGSSQRDYAAEAMGY